MYFCNIISNVRNMKRFLLVLTTFMIGVAAVAQVKTFSLNHGFNHDAKVYDDTLFVACDKGLYAYPLKVESGTWKVYAFENRIVYNFVKSGSHLLAVTNENEVAGRKQSLLRSDDYGRTFSDVTPSEALVQKVYDDYDAKIIQLYQRPNDLNGLFIGYPKEPDNSSSVFHSSALMESSDFGLHWEKKNSAPPCNGKMAFSFNDAAHMLVCGLTPNVHCSCPYIIETKDDFQNLTNVPYDIVDDDDQVIYHHPDYSMGATSGIIFHQIVFNPSSSQTLLAATTTGIAKSDDGGKTWMHTLIEMSRGYYIYIGVGKVCYDQTNPQTVYAVRNHDDKGQYGYSLYLSQDGGGSWQKTYTSQVSSNASWIRELLVYNDQLILIAHEDEVLCIDKNDISNPTNPEPDIAYRPFLKEGKTWKFEEYYHNVWDDEEWTKDVSYVINGTTEIDGKTYYKMYRVSEEGSEYNCALREEDKKVWKYSSDDGEKLLYDFNMSVGDSYMPVGDWRIFKLVAINPIRVHDVLLNAFHYDVRIEHTAEIVDVISVPIVEGVGCSKGWNLARLFSQAPTNGIIHRENFLSCCEDGKCIFTVDDFYNLPTPKPVDDMTYRPFVEDGKVWKVGTIPSTPESPVQVVDYYYFDGDTIIDGKTCKQMWCQRYVNPDYADYSALTQTSSLSKVGAWYEFIIGPRQTGGIDGFKGVYRDIMMSAAEGQNIHSTFWLEGIGDINGPTRIPYNPILGDPVPEFLMSCTVGDEVIYLNDEYEDGATPEGMTALKKRFDFTHTTKLQPKAPVKRENSDASISSSEREVARPNVKTPRRTDEELSLYGEYNDKLLGINLDPLDDAYQVSITNESGKAVYKKTVNAGTIVGLSIDISAYAKGRYTVTVENSNEVFTGEFETETTGIEVIYNKVKTKTEIYNLQGQRIHSLQKGLNIYGGRKIVK